MHQLFASLFPEIAEKETRIVHILGKDTGLLPGDYLIQEYYCTDPGCDCRQVYLQVLRIENNQETPIEAEISFGWEPMNWYVNWFGRADESLPDFKGPSLNRLAKQGPQAPQWLNYLKWMLKTDKDYVKRLEKHYRLLRKPADAEQSSDG